MRSKQVLKHNPGALNHPSGSNRERSQSKSSQSGVQRFGLSCVPSHYPDSVWSRQDDIPPATVGFKGQSPKRVCRAVGSSSGRGQGLGQCIAFTHRRPGYFAVETCSRVLPLVSLSSWPKKGFQLVRLQRGCHVDVDGNGLNYTRVKLPVPSSGTPRLLSSNFLSSRRAKSSVRPSSPRVLHERSDSGENRKGRGKKGT